MIKNDYGGIILHGRVKFPLEKGKETYGSPDSLIFKELNGQFQREYLIVTYSLIEVYWKTYLEVLH